jgi:hypothetical protein
MKHVRLKLCHLKDVLGLPLFLSLGLMLPLLGNPRAAMAQDLTQLFSWPTPPLLQLRTFASGYGAEKYGTTHEGFELDQTLSGAAGLVGRVSGYQIYQGTGFDSPLVPSAHSAPRNFGRFEGGISLIPAPGALFEMLGGEDVGDSHAAMFENDFSSWLWLHSRHPISFSYSGNHYYENGVSNGLIDLRAVAVSTAEMILLAGGWRRRGVGRRNGGAGQGSGWPRPRYVCAPLARQS